MFRCKFCNKWLPLKMESKVKRKFCNLCFPSYDGEIERIIKNKLLTPCGHSALKVVCDKCKAKRLIDNYGGGVKGFSMNKNLTDTKEKIKPLTSSHYAKKNLCDYDLAFLRFKWLFEKDDCFGDVVHWKKSFKGVRRY